MINSLACKLMSSFFDGMIAKYNSGMPQSIRDRYIISCRMHPTDFAIRRTIETAIRLGDIQHLIGTIEDEEFRSLRVRLLGINALRDDIRLCLQFYASAQNSPYYILKRYLFSRVHFQRAGNCSIVISAIAATMTTFCN